VWRDSGIFSFGMNDTTNTNGSETMASRGWIENVVRAEILQAATGGTVWAKSMVNRLRRNGIGVSVHVVSGILRSMVKDGDLVRCVGDLANYTAAGGAR